MRDLENIRKEIAAVDVQMAELFERRMRAAKEVAAYKKERGLQIEDLAQEKRLLERNVQYIEDDLFKPYYLTFLQDMMDVSKKLQNRLINGAKVAFSGVEGAFAHIAARRIYPNGNCIAFGSFDEAYLSVVEGECDYAVLPIENSYAGEVGQVIDLMFHGSLHVNGVYNLPVTHDLLCVPGAGIEDIKTVISHPQALAQCQPFIRQHGFAQQTEVNTAVAAEKAARLGDPTVAVIASEEAAQLYGLQVLEREINESHDNTTRFAVFSRTENTENTVREGSTFILLFRVNNVAGALADGLQVIGKYGFNMKVLRSRPIKTTPWKYYFYVEAEGNPASRDGQAMIEELKEHCDMLKVAGQYTAKEEPLTRG